MSKKKNDYGDFNSDVGMPQEERWEYPTIGYNATNGIFYVGDEQQSEIKGMTLLAIRQCKEVTDSNETIHRYPLRTRKVDMIDGDYSARWQGIVYYNDELHTFGARSWTARAAFMNPAGGPYKDDNFGWGIYHELTNHVKEIGKETGQSLPPLCWSFDIAADPKTVTVGSGKNTSEAHPIIRQSEFAFIGADVANKLAALYTEESIDEWVSEWGKREVTEAQIEEPEPALFDEDEEDEIPF